MTQHGNHNHSENVISSTYNDSLERSKDGCLQFKITTH